MNSRSAHTLFLLVILVSLTVGGIWPATAQEAEQPDTEPGRVPMPGSVSEPDSQVEFKPGEVLVRFEAEASSVQVEAALEVSGATYVRDLYGSDTQLWQVPEGQELATVGKLNADPSVEYAQPNYRYDAFGTPNDPYFGNQWAHSKMQSSAAWDISTGSASISIAILDTGIDEAHPDLSTKIVTGWDFVDNDSNPHDLHGHGTHVAGIAAAATDNGKGVAGMDWQARIMPVRVLGADGGGWTDDIADGVTWAYLQGADVLNLSLGGGGNDPALESAINQAHAAGSLVVAAMGNEDSGVPSYPAAYNNVLAVAATGPNDHRAYYSNYGSHCDVAAPGGDMGYLHDPDGIYSTLPTYWVTMTGEGYSKNYDYLQGTSQATPHVAGLAALVWSLDASLTPDEVQTVIEDTAVDLGSPGWDQKFGHGRIDALAALEAVAGPSVPGAPTLYSISNPDGDGDYRVRWSTVSGATSYRLQEDDNASFTSPTQRYAGANTQYQVTGQGAGTWYYRVRASNAAGNSPWSNVESVTVVPGAPALDPIENPSNGDAYDLVWSAVAGATGYELEEDDNPAFSSPEVRYAGTATQYSVTGQREGIWYYRVHAYNAGGDSPPSNVESTMVDPLPYNWPDLDDIDNAGGDGEYLVVWGEVISATSYTLEESDNAYFVDPVEVYTGTDTLLTVTDQPGGTWHYRVRAHGPAGSSPWSDTRSVVVTTRAFLPLATRSYCTGEPPANVILNGGFESGPVDWTEYSQHGWDLIIKSSFPGSVAPHSGNWAVWLGGDLDDVSYIQQAVTVPASKPHLRYWHWIASEDLFCGYDFGKVVFKGIVVDAYDLCVSTITGGWVEYSVDLSAYIGQSALLQIWVETDFIWNSNLFVDDVSFQATAASLSESPSIFDEANAAPRPGVASPEGPQPGRDPDQKRHP